MRLVGEGNGTPIEYSCLKIPWAEEPGRLQSMGSLRVRQDWATSLSLFTFQHWRRKWWPTPVFLPGESQGRGSLAGCRLWGCTESDTAEATQQQQQQQHEVSTVILSSSSDCQSHIHNGWCWHQPGGEGTAFPPVPRGGDQRTEVYFLWLANGIPQGHEMCLYFT